MKRKPEPCVKCGRPRDGRAVSGLCKPCYNASGDARRGRRGYHSGPTEYGICMMCRKRRPVPPGKGKRWFRCTRCDVVAEEYRAGLHWTTHYFYAPREWHK